MEDEHNPVKDQTGHPERIVSLSPSNTEILFAIGAGDNVVGVTDHCNYPPSLKARIEADKIKRIGGYWNPSLPSITSLKPDLVLVSTVKCTGKEDQCKVNCSQRCKVTTTVANRLRSSGINVLTLTPHSVEDVLDNILAIGRTTGKTIEASDLVKKLRNRIKTVVTKAKAEPNAPTVYFEVWNDPYVSVNSETWIGDLIQLAGGKNVFSEAVLEWPILRSEEIVQRNPDVMLFPVIPGVPRFWKSFQAVKNRPRWEGLNAIKNQRLYEVSRDLISRPGPRLVEALEIIAEKIMQVK